MGHEAAGVIVAVGEGVSENRIGERVVMYYYVGCGSCRWQLKSDVWKIYCSSDHAVAKTNYQTLLSGSQILLSCLSCRWCKVGDEQLCPDLKAQLGFVSDGDSFYMAQSGCNKQVTVGSRYSAYSSAVILLIPSLPCAGCLAQFLVAPERNAVVLPDSLSFEAAAPIGTKQNT